MRAALQAKHALADVLGIVDLGTRELDLGIAAFGLEDDIIGNSILVGNAQILGLEHDTVDQDEIGVVHHVDEMSHFAAPFDLDDTLHVSKMRPE
jgi:hypothetical protein